MIIPVTIDDNDLIVLHKKVNRKTGNVSLQHVRETADEVIRRYVEFELLEKIFEELTEPGRRFNAD